jgi:hypothetical protein
VLPFSQSSATSKERHFFNKFVKKNFGHEPSLVIQHFKRVQALLNNVGHLSCVYIGEVLSDYTRENAGNSDTQ